MLPRRRQCRLSAIIYNGEMARHAPKAPVSLRRGDSGDAEILSQAARFRKLSAFSRDFRHRR